MSSSPDLSPLIGLSVVSHYQHGHSGHPQITPEAFPQPIRHILGTTDSIKLRSTNEFPKSTIATIEDKARIIINDSYSDTIGSIEYHDLKEEWKVKISTGGEILLTDAKNKQRRVDIYYGTTKEMGLISQMPGFNTGLVYSCDALSRQSSAPAPIEQIATKIIEYSSFSLILMTLILAGGIIKDPNPPQEVVDLLRIMSPACLIVIPTFLNAYTDSLRGLIEEFNFALQTGNLFHITTAILHNFTAGANEILIKNNLIRDVKEWKTKVNNEINVDKHSRLGKLLTSLNK